jgi:hypothetical protein
MINHHNSDTKDITIMFIIMIIAAIFSGMNMWVSNISDIRIQLNDIYMGIIMAGWMFLLMGIFYSLNNYIWIGSTTIILLFYFIRNQIFVNQYEYLNSMIPHHSMAVFMSEKIKQKNIIKDQEINDLVSNIITTQEEEIRLMKKYS